jgi:hypothetical protein
MAKKSRGEQYLFVNDRFFKDPYFHHAITKAYDGMISGEPLPDDIVQAFRQAVLLEEERIRQQRREESRRG